MVYHPPNLEGVTILVVDDDPDAREVIVRILRDARASVTTASSATEALVILRESKPDLLMSDIEMPGEDGYDLIRIVRALTANAGGRVPAVVLIAFARSVGEVAAVFGVLAPYRLRVAGPSASTPPSHVVRAIDGGTNIITADPLADTSI
jgi:CheY-like chemotaxis protein